MTWLLLPVSSHDDWLWFMRQVRGSVIGIVDQKRTEISSICNSVTWCIAPSRKLNIHCCFICRDIYLLVCPAAIINRLSDHHVTRTIIRSDWNGEYIYRPFVLGLVVVMEVVHNSQFVNTSLHHSALIEASCVKISQLFTS